MEIEYTNDAFNALMDLVIFIEDKNTRGAGSRWLKKFEFFLQNTLRHSSIIRRCSNATFKALKLKCIYYNNWVIAFSEKRRF